MLSVENVSKIYQVGTFGGKELHAVSGANFEIHPGEVVSLIGESGSGKSTIGKMILRLLPISAGKIIYNGRDISALQGAELKEYYRNVQGIFQDPFSSYNPIFKVGRVYKLIRETFFPGMSDEEWDGRVRNALHAVGLNPDECLEKFPHQLSGGQLQRLLIARALLLDVSFLVADEIISMLDASTRIDVLNLLADLKARGLAVLFITHDLSLGYYISEKALIMHRGVIVEMGLTEKVYNNPRHPYTRHLMMAVPRLDRKWPAGEAELPPAPATNGRAYYDTTLARSRNGDAEWVRPVMVEVEPGHFVAVGKR